MASPTLRAPPADSWPSLVAWLLACAAAGAIGAIASIEAKTFNAALTRPSWAPPSGVFGPGWTGL
jgi:tryptophan-rich sensory protein